MKYQARESQQTLREGLAEYYEAFPSLDRFAENDSRIVAQAFMAHDAVHVITGMDISPESEIILDTWQFWATYPGKDFWNSMRVTKKIFSDREFNQRIKDIITASSLKDWLWWFWRCFIPCCKAIAFSWQMTKKWHTYDFQNYLEVPLVNIRAEYNIKVMQQGETALIPNLSMNYQL